jgi:hypothetical protein
LRSDLVSAIAALPEPYRKILILRDVDELTAPETAERLNISIDAVKSRLHRARTMVREQLLSSGYLKTCSPDERSDIRSDSAPHGASLMRATKPGR